MPLRQAEAQMWMDCEFLNLQDESTNEKEAERESDGMKRETKREGKDDIFGLHSHKTLLI